MESLSLLSVVTKGGILMYPIFICSIIVFAVAIERYVTYKKLNINIPKFMMNIRHPLNNRDFLAAINECNLVNGPVASVVRAGLEKAKSGRERVREAMETAGNNETYHLEKNMNILATLGSITPLIGFLGTVTGMIKAFMKIQQLSGNVNADVLAGGIWEAMVTTAAGLTVGIPTMIIYNYFVHRVREFIFQMESTADEVIDIIGTAHIEKNKEPDLKPEVSPHKPSPDDADILDNEGGFKLADETFDPEDKNFDGGLTS